MYNLSRFKEFLEASYRKGTVYEYMWRVRKFTEWLSRRRLQVSSLTQSDIMDYMSELRKNVKQPVTYAYAIKCYFEYLGRKDLSGMVPVQRVNVQKVPLWLPFPAVKVLVDSIKDARTKALCSIMYDLALRVNEALAMRVGPLTPDVPWVNLDTGLANVYRLKTKQYPFMNLTLSSWANSILSDYVKQYRIAKGRYLFETKPYRAWMKGGGRMSESEASYLWRQIRENYGLPDDFTLHSFRHSRLTWMSVMGSTIIDISKFAGHSSTNPTLIYTHLKEQFLNKPDIVLQPFSKCIIYDEMLEATLRWYDRWRHHTT